VKSQLPAGAMIVATGTCVLAQGSYWVVGNRVQSFDDGKLARSNILQCPAVEQPPAKTPDDENKSN
jgi:hypothetical protein